MKHIQTAILIFLSLIIFSCNNDNKKSIIIKENNSFKVKINPHHQSDSKNKPASELIEDYKYILLETTQASLIGKIDKVRFYKDHIFIMDARKSKRLQMFDLSGKYIRTIGRLGKGPLEYSYLTDFIISTKKDQILILDRGSRKVMRFNMEGKLLGTVKLNFWTKNFMELGDNLIFYSGNSGSNDARFGKKLNYNLLYTSNEGVILSKMLPIPKAHIGYGKSHSNTFTSFNGENYFTPIPGNKVYKIKNNLIETYFEIDFGEYNPSLDTYVKHPSPSVMMSTKYIAYDVSDFLETENYLSFKYTFNSHLHTIIYNKEEEVYYDLVDDIFLGVMGGPIAVHDDWYVFNIDNVLVSSYSNLPSEIYDKHIQGNEKIRKLVNNFKPTDNPALLLVKWK